MFSVETNYSKLKTNLRLAINRLKLAEKKKSELNQKARKEIADFISAGKYERAKIRVEYIIREDYLIEAYELIEMYCELLLSRFGLIQSKTLEESISEAVSSILWVSPFLHADIPEIKVISDQLTLKYGKRYAEACRVVGIDSISEKLKHKMSVQSPPKILVEKYLVEIAKNYNVPYEPDPQVMKEEEQSKGLDALLFDNIPNNLGGDRPPGFIGYPQAPLLPENIKPFDYPIMSEKPSAPNPMSMSMPTGGYPLSAGQPSHPMMPMPPTSFSYNIPPDSALPDYDSIKPINTAQNHISQPTLPAQPFPQTTDRNKQSNQTPKPLPRAKLTPPDNFPELPSVPSDVISGGGNVNSNSSIDDIDFDDLSRRFEELKKRH
uniref:IST1 homolog n=1 Tax=Clastoptera arizonana TaxID=38151 RepID=A0A1B6DK45_9HEMI